MKNGFLISACPAVVRAAVLGGHYENDCSHTGCGAIGRDCHIPLENHNPIPSNGAGCCP